VARGSDAPKLGQHLKYDAHVFANHGIALRGIAHDTMLESYVLASHRNHGMDSLAERLLSLKTITYEEVAARARSQIGFDQIDLRAPPNTPPRMPTSRCACIARCCRSSRRGRAEVRLRQIEMPVSVVLQKIERNGVLIDADRLAAQSAELGRMMELEAPHERPASRSISARPSRSARSCSTS
jgi:DNA polymerase-1